MSIKKRRKAPEMKEGRNTMLDDILTRRKKDFAPGVHTELRAQVNKTRGVSFLSGSLTTNVRSEVSGVSARVYKNGVYGFSSAAEYDADAVAAVLAAATENALFMDKRAGRGTSALLPVDAGQTVREITDSDPVQKDYIDFAGALDAYMEKNCPGLSGRGVSIRADSMEKLLCVSQGHDAHVILPRCYVYLRMTADTSAGNPVELFVPVGGHGTFDTVFSDPALLYPKVDELYEKLMQKREGVYPQAGEKTCILSGELTGMLAHEAVGHTVEADLVLGGSVAAHSLGKTVASPLVTMVDYAHTCLGAPAPLPIYVDDEGTPAKDVVLIQNGVLTGYMNSRQTAQHFDMEPCGNARAYLFSDEPLIRMRNTAIVPGTSKLEDMIASVEDGYYFIDTNNGQADTTGEFMFGVCMGYEIKNGKLGRALLDTTISGVAFEMLKTVDMVGDTISWSSSGFCGKKQPMPVGLGGPAIRCKITVGGR